MWIIRGYYCRQVAFSKGVSVRRTRGNENGLKMRDKKTIAGCRHPRTLIVWPPFRHASALLPILLNRAECLGYVRTILSESCCFLLLHAFLMKIGHCWPLVMMASEYPPPHITLVGPLEPLQIYYVCLIHFGHFCFSFQDGQRWWKLNKLEKLYGNLTFPFLICWGFSVWTPFLGLSRMIIIPVIISATAVSNSSLFKIVKLIAF